MSSRRLRILHAIHDFLPRYQAGSEIYASELGRALQSDHHVTVLSADFDAERPHGHVTWRVHQGLPVVELVNNWVCESFTDTYASPLINRRLEQILRMVQPDVVHVHNLLNLSFALPRLAHVSGAGVVATLHDYTLVCPSGGQRVHQAERHVCHQIDTARCARCFSESPFFERMAMGHVSGSIARGGALTSMARYVSRRFPAAANRTARAVGRAASGGVSVSDIDDRLRRAREVFAEVDLFVAPSRSLADEFVALGLDPSRVRVSDYGFPPFGSCQVEAPDAGRLRIGYVGSLVWHKGVHVLIDALRRLPPSGWSATIFGDPDVQPAYTRTLRTQAAQLPVEFAGPFPHHRAPDIFARIDVLVVPSVWLENSPLVIHEAFMAGVPVVGARLGGTADLVRHGENGLLYEPDSSKGLAVALEELMRDPARRQALADGAPAVKTIDDDADQWRGFYREVLTRRAARGAAVG